jgi:ABC-type transport system involved in multi-copper enzyme maturation permease subunit
MFSVLLIKELKAIILSPKFAATLGVCTVLMLLSVWIGIREYHASLRQYEAAQQLNDQEMRQQTSWRFFSSKAFRPPDPMQVFVSGVNYDLGRWSEIGGRTPIKLEGSVYSDDPIFALFRYFDFAFVVQFVFSLLAILFTYDSISGERESGTLKLVFSNSVPKAQYLLAKATGAVSGLIVPILLPILLSLLLVRVAGVPLSTANWVSVAGLIVMSLLYFCAFIMVGLLISTITRSSNVSFLVSLVVWVVFVLIIPRTGVIVAGQMTRVPSYSEIEGQRAAFAQDKMTQLQQLLSGGAERAVARKGGGCEVQAGKDIAALIDSASKANEAATAEYEAKLMNDYRRRKSTQERLGLSLSRFSPSSAYQLAAQTLASTDLSLKTRYEDAMATYRTELADYASGRPDAQPGGRIAISVSEEGMKFDVSKGSELDISGVPRFDEGRAALRNAASAVVVDAGLLSLCILLAFAGAFLAFLRYDVR